MMANIDVIKRIAEYAPHLLTAEDRRILRYHCVKSAAKRNAYILGLTVGAILTLSAIAAFAETVSLDGGNTSVTVSPSDQFGAVAEVSFSNYLEPMASSRHTVVTGIDGIELMIEVETYSGDVPDIMTVIPPEGYIAIPGFVIVDEGDTETLGIYTLEGVGM